MGRLRLLSRRHDKRLRLQIRAGGSRALRLSRLHRNGAGPWFVSPSILRRDLIHGNASSVEA